MALYQDRGIVVSGFRLGEADKIVTIVTEGRGVLRAVAKGVRKTKSRFAGRLEPLSHVSLQAYVGRSLDTITGADALSPWMRVRAHADRLGTALAIVEAGFRASHEHEPAPRMYKLLVASLEGLDGLTAGKRVPPMYLTVCLLRVLDVAGLSFAARECAACGISGAFDRVGIAEGGALCSRCTTSPSYRVGTPVIDLLGRISTGRVAITAIEAGSPPDAGEAAALVRRFAEYHLDVRLRAPAIASQLA